MGYVSLQEGNPCRLHDPVDCISGHSCHFHFLLSTFHGQQKTSEPSFLIRKDLYFGESSPKVSMFFLGLKFLERFLQFNLSLERNF